MQFKLVAYPAAIAEIRRKENIVFYLRMYAIAAGGLLATIFFSNAENTIVFFFKTLVQKKQY
jgi:hypothetical protein